MNNQPRKIEGKIIPFEEVVGARWQEYNLADGNVLRIKVELLKVLSTGKKNPAGEPIYNIMTHPVMVVFTEEQGYVKMKK